MQANQLCLLSALSAREFHQYKVSNAISQVAAQAHIEALESYDNFISAFYANPVNNNSIEFLINNGFVTKKEGFITAKGKAQVSQDPSKMSGKDLGIKTLFSLKALVERGLLDNTTSHFDDKMVNNILASLLMEATIRAESREFYIDESVLDTIAGLILLAYPQAIFTPEVQSLGALVPLEEEAVEVVEPEVEVINLVKPKKSRKKETA
jgi:hypothetical protein